MHLAVAVISAVGGVLALLISAQQGQVVGLGGLLAVLLLVNAVLRYQLSRR